MQGKLIKWNGRAAQVRYVSRADRGDQLKAIIENMNGGVSVAVYTSDGSVHLAYANERYYQLFGYTREQFVLELKDAHDMILPKDREFVRAAMQGVKKTRQATTFRYSAKRRDGSVIIVRCSSSVAAIRGLGENVLMSVLTDITDSVQSEQRALVYGQRLDAIMGHINNGIAASILKADGGVDYVFVTDRYYEILGFTREEYRQEVTDPFDLIHPDDREDARREASRLRTVGECATLRYRALRRDGQIIFLSVCITIMTFADVDSPVQLSVFTDVTHLMETKALLEAQRNQISDLINDTPGGIAILEVNPKDPAGGIHTVYYNDTFFQLLRLFAGGIRRAALRERNALCL